MCIAAEVSSSQLLPGPSQFAGELCQNCEVEACSNNLGLMSRYQSLQQEISRRAFLRFCIGITPWEQGESICRQCVPQVRAVMSLSLLELHFVGHQSLWPRGLEATI